MWSSQALAILIFYVIAAFIIGGMTIKAGSTTSGIMIIVAMVISAVILAYDTNCLTEGGCGVWSWIRTVVYCLQPIIIIYALATGTGSLTTGSLTGSTTIPTPSS
jgi:hypothetical protein